jgi:endonuclease/exonuclease/phosphatase family metal-dependent hydrolase
MEVLTWNLFHGRAVAPAGRDLLAEFAAALAAWDWDVALLQEVPPWWPAPLARACGAEARGALTSRNALLALTRPLARRHPDLLKSWGGGANAILVRGMTITADCRVLLRRWPERRVCHGVAPADGPWCANVHAQVGSERRARADIARAAEATLRCAHDGAAILGGDLNVRHPGVAGFEWLGGHGVDHVLGHRMRPGPNGTRVLEHGRLSDHPPVLVSVVAQDATRSG